MTNKTLSLIAIALVVVVVSMGTFNQDQSPTEEKTSSEYTWDDSWREGDEKTTEPVVPDKKPEEKPKEQTPVKKKGLVAASYKEALELSGKEGLPILLIFSGSHCDYCRIMDETVYPNGKVKAIMENYIVCKLDTGTQENSLIAQKFGVQYIPAFVISNYKEEKLKFEQKSMDVNTFSAWIENPSMYTQPKVEVKKVEEPKPAPEPEKKKIRPIKPWGSRRMNAPDPDGPSWWGNY